MTHIKSIKESKEKKRGFLKRAKAFRRDKKGVE